MCGHGIIAVVTIAIERGLITPRGGRTRDSSLDAPAGQIRARADDRDAGRRPPARRRACRSSTCRRSSSRPALPVDVGTAARMPVDVAFGGAFYAIVDAEAAGLPVTPERLPELRATGMAIKHAVERAITVVHPTEPGLTGIYGTIFTGPPTAPGARSAQRDDLRGRRGRSIAVRHRHVRGARRARRDGPRRSVAAVRAREHHRHDVQRARRRSHDRRRSRRRSCPSSPASAWITGEHTFSSIRTIRCAKGFRI